MTTIEWRLRLAFRLCCGLMIVRDSFVEVKVKTTRRFEVVSCYAGKRICDSGYSDT